MTFRESEFPNLIGLLSGVVNRYPPAAISLFVQEMIRIYKAIPLYPGLVCMCMGKAFKMRTQKDPPPKGSFVVVRLKGASTVGGNFLSWTAGGIQIESRDVFGKLRRTRLPKNRVQMVEQFQADTLETLWPTLVFDKKPATKSRK